VQRAVKQSIQILFVAVIAAMFSPLATERAAVKQMMGAVAATVNSKKFR
jgi:hypothetical protein